MLFVNNMIFLHFFNRNEPYCLLFLNSKFRYSADTLLCRKPQQTHWMFQTSILKITFTAL